MPVTPFKAVTWAKHDPITKDKLDAMANNDIWLKENSPKAHYSKVPGSEEFETGLVLVSGRLYIPRKKYNTSATGLVYFGAAFLPGTKPQVTTGLISDKSLKLWVTLRGFSPSLEPDHRGFRINMAIENPAARPKKVRGRKQTNPVVSGTYCSWLALGQAKVA